MKNIALFILITMAAGLSQAALAGHHHPHHGNHEAHERETIVIVHEHNPGHAYRRMRAHRPAEPVYHRPTRHPRAAEEMIAGGVMGAILGSQLDRGHDRVTFTVLGTLVGASIGHDMAYHRDRHGHRHNRYCRNPRHWHQD